MLFDTLHESNGQILHQLNLNQHDNNPWDFFPDIFDVPLQQEKNCRFGELQQVFFFQTLFVFLKEILKQPFFETLPASRFQSWLL